MSRVCVLVVLCSFFLFSYQSFSSESLLPTNLIKNGSFEDGHTLTRMNSWSTYSQVSNWQRVASLEQNFELQYGHRIGGLTPSLGLTKVELDGRRNCGVEQNISVDSGEDYILLFDLARRTTRSDDNLAQVWVNDTMLAEITPDAVGWKTYRYELIAQSDSLKLSFHGAGVSNGLGAYLDNVRLYKKQELLFFGNNLIDNPSFEQGHGLTKNNTWKTYPQIDGWNAKFSEVPILFEVQKGGTAGLNPSHGNFKIELDGRKNAGLYQEVATEVGQQYTLSFDYSARTTRATSNDMEIYINGNFVQKISSVTKGWKRYEFSAVAPSSITRIEFRGAGRSDGLGAFLDNVSFTKKDESNNLLINPSFEENSLKRSWALFESIPGWKSSLTEQKVVPIEVQFGNRVGGLSAQSGNSKIELDSNANSVVSQNISTEEDAQYLLRFFYTPRVAGNDSTNALKVLWNDEEVLSLNRSDLGWRAYELLVSASDLESSLSFVGAGTSDSYGALIDSVSLMKITPAFDIYYAIKKTGGAIMADFSADELPQGLSTDQIESFEWDFEGIGKRVIPFGTSGSDEFGYMAMNFESAKTIKVSLTINTKDGKKISSGTRSIELTDGGLPTPKFSVSTYHGEAPLTVNFSAVDAYASNNEEIVKYCWRTDTGNQCGSDLKELSHTFANPGAYQVRLKITSSSGLSERVYIPIYVGVDPPANTLSPVAIISTSKRYGTAPYSTTFTGRHSFDPEGEDLTYRWEVRDYNTPGEKIFTTQDLDYTFSYGGTYEVILSVTDAQGAQDVDRMVVFADSMPEVEADFFAELIPDHPGTVRFHVDPLFFRSPYDPASLMWTIEEGSTPRTYQGREFLIQNFSTPGEIPVSMSIRTVSGGFKSVTKSIKFHEGAVNPQVSIVADKNLYEVGETATITAILGENEDIAKTSFRWDYNGHVQKGIGADFKVYEQALSEKSIRPVVLYATNEDGFSSRASAVLRVDDSVNNNAPIAKISAYDYNPIVPEEIFFDAIGSMDTDGFITNYHYDFGDGATGVSEGGFIGHTYTTPGTYTVTLTVTDNLGASGTDTLEVTVNANQIPTAGLTLYGTEDLIAPTQIGANGYPLSMDNDGYIANYQMDWGDGTTESSESSDFNHTYTTPGTYTLTLTVTDDKGATASDIKTLTIAANQAPIAGLIVETESPRVNSEVFATGYPNSSDSDGNIATYKIEWGDGDSVTSDQARHSHTYSEAGTYTITLTVTDNKGATATDSKQIEVTEDSESPIAEYALVSSNRTVGATIQIDTSGSSDPDGTISSVNVSWGDGGISTGVSGVFSHVYSTAGTYDVTVKVTDNSNKESEATGQIRVTNPDSDPIAHLTIEETVRQTYRPFIVDGSGSGGNIASYSWEFSDGHTDTGDLVGHFFETVGEHWVRLTITDVNGKTNSVEQVLNVVESLDLVHEPKIESNLNESGHVYERLTVNAIRSKLPKPLNFYEIKWIYSDGTETAGSDDIKTFASDGEYQAVLSIKDIESNITLTETLNINYHVNEQFPEPENSDFDLTVAGIDFDNFNPMSLQAEVSLSGDAITQRQFYPMLITLNGVDLSLDNALSEGKLNLNFNAIDGRNELYVKVYDSLGKLSERTFYFYSGQRTILVTVNNLVGSASNLKTDVFIYKDKIASRVSSGTIQGNDIVLTNVPNDQFSIVAQGENSSIGHVIIERDITSTDLDMKAVTSIINNTNLNFEDGTASWQIIGVDLENQNVVDVDGVKALEVESSSEEIILSTRLKGQEANQIYVSQTIDFETIDSSSEVYITYRSLKDNRVHMVAGKGADFVGEGENFGTAGLGFARNDEVEVRITVKNSSISTTSLFDYLISPAFADFFVAKFKVSGFNLTIEEPDYFFKFDLVDRRDARISNSSLSEIRGLSVRKSENEFVSREFYPVLRHCDVTDFGSFNSPVDSFCPKAGSVEVSGVQVLGIVVYGKELNSYRTKETGLFIPVKEERTISIGSGKEFSDLEDVNPRVNNSNNVDSAYSFELSQAQANTLVAAFTKNGSIKDLIYNISMVYVKNRQSAITNLSSLNLSTVSDLQYAPLNRSTRNFYYDETSFLFGSLFISADLSNLPRTESGMDEYNFGSGIVEGADSLLFRKVGGDFWTTSSGKNWLGNFFEESDRESLGVRIGDISNANGGGFSPHGTHAIGKAIDLTTNYISGTRSKNSYSREMLYDLNDLLRDFSGSHQIESIRVSKSGREKIGGAYRDFVNYDLSGYKNGFLSVQNNICLGDYTAGDLLRNDSKGFHKNHLHFQIDQGQSLRNRPADLENIAIGDPLFEVVTIDDFGTSREFHKYTYTASSTNDGSRHFDIFIEEFDTFGRKIITPLYEEFNSIHNNGCPVNDDSCEELGAFDSSGRYGTNYFEGASRHPFRVKILQDVSPKRVEIYVDFSSKKLVEKYSKIKIQQTDRVFQTFGDTQRIRCRTGQRKLQARFCKNNSGEYKIGEFFGDGAFVSAESFVDPGAILGSGVEVCSGEVQAGVSLSGSIRVDGNSRIVGDSIIEAFGDNPSSSAFKEDPIILIDNQSQIDTGKDQTTISSSVESRLVIDNASHLTGAIDIFNQRGKMVIGSNSSGTGARLEALTSEDKVSIICNHGAQEELKVDIDDKSSLKNNLEIICATDSTVTNIKNSTLEGNHENTYLGADYNRISISQGFDIINSTLKGGVIVSANISGSSVTSDDYSFASGLDEHDRVTRFYKDVSGSTITGSVQTYQVVANSNLQGRVRSLAGLSGVSYNSGVAPCEISDISCKSLDVSIDVLDFVLTGLNESSVKLKLRDQIYNQFPNQSCYNEFNSFDPDGSGEYISGYHEVYVDGSSTGQRACSVRKEEF